MHPQLWVLATFQLNTINTSTSLTHPLKLKLVCTHTVTQVATLKPTQAQQAGSYTDQSWPKPYDAITS